MEQTVQTKPITQIDISAAQVGRVFGLVPSMVVCSVEGVAKCKYGYSEMYEMPELQERQGNASGYAAQLPSKQTPHLTTLPSKSFLLPAFLV